jgi:chromosomal replication initiator protein
MTLEAKKSTEIEQASWTDLKNSLCNHFDEDVFNKWLAKLNSTLISPSEIIISAPSKFLRDWVKREYLPEIKTLWLKNLPNLRKISIIVDEKKQSEPNLFSSQNIEKTSSKKIVNLSKYDNVFAFGTNLNPKFTFQNFIEGKCNKLAFNAAKIIANDNNNNQEISSADINPLFLYGDVGLGKTHLGQAVAWHAKDHNKNSKVVYLSAERFMHQFVQSIRNKDVVDFKEKFRSIDLLIIDDLQFITGKEGTQEELLYTISSLIEDGKKVVLICDRSPGDLNNIGDKLKSRMSGGMIADFKCPDYATRLDILKAKNADLEHKIDEEILDLLATKISSNIRDLEGALKKLVINQLFTGEEITLKNAHDLLQDLFRTASKELTIADIQKIVAKEFSITIQDIKSSCRSRKIARPRQIAMYFSKKLTDKNLPDIGLAFGGKNHATVIHAVKTVEELTIKDNEFNLTIKEIADKLAK